MAGSRCACCAKILLITINLFMVLLGLAFTLAGAALKFGGSLIEPFLTPFIGDLIPKAGEATGPVQLDVDVLFGDVGIALMVLGLITLTISIYGMAGACCGKKPVLLKYAVILILFVVAQLTLVIIVALGVFDDQLKSKLKEVAKTKYGGIDTYDTMSLLMNVVMLKFECCGIDGYADFKNSNSWKNVQEITLMSTKVNATLITPLACCVLDAPYPNGKPINEACAVVPDDSTNNWNKGCYEELRTFFGEHYKWPTVGVVGGVLLLQLILAIMALVLRKQSDDDDDDDDDRTAKKSKQTPVRKF